MNDVNDFFGEEKTEPRRIDVLPCSVVDVGRQQKQRRLAGGHDEQSSRSGYSHFPAEASSLCLQLFLANARHVFDPFAGWGERHAACVAAGKQYTGFDVSEFAIEEARRVYGVENTLANSMKAEIPAFDGLLTCPPYWNLEQYSEAGIDAARSWDEFLSFYGTILRRCYEAAQPGAMFCIFTGDWRSKHIYFDLTFQTRLAMQSCGARFWDEVVFSRLGVSKVKIMIPQAVRLGYTVKVHETLSVFLKT